MIIREKRIEPIEKIEKYLELSSPTSIVGSKPASPRELFVKMY